MDRNALLCMVALLVTGVSCDRIDDQERWPEKEGFRSRAAVGDPEAMRHLASLYYDFPESQGGSTDSALHWFRQSARRGDALSQFNLIFLAMSGSACDLDSARAWRRELTANPAADDTLRFWADVLVRAGCSEDGQAR